MAWVETNNNPTGRRVGDCAVRAVSEALSIPWESAYILLALNGFVMGDMPSSDSVWGATLRQSGFEREAIPNNYPEDYTVSDFARDNDRGVYVLAIGGHVVTVRDGDILDSWDSGNEIPQYVWSRKEY